MPWNIVANIKGPAGPAGAAGATGAKETQVLSVLPVLYGVEHGLALIHMPLMTRSVGEDLHILQL